MKNIVVSLSGGMDSTTLLLRSILEVGADNVTALSFDYGQKHRLELERAESLIAYLNNHGMPVRYDVIKLDGLQSLLKSTLVEGGDDVPEGHYEEANMRETVVPNRNKIFSSIIQAVALSIANEMNETCHIALGIHAGDHAVYPDCRQEFRDADHNAFLLGNWGGEAVQYFTPYLESMKFDILKDGVHLCEAFELDFNEVYKRTNTSYKPVYVNSTGTWESDYKSSSSTERIEAFIDLGRPDPVQYADEDGLVDWEVARDYAQSVLNEYKERKAS